MVMLMGAGLPVALASPVETMSLVCAEPSPGTPPAVPPSTPSPHYEVDPYELAAVEQHVWNLTPEPAAGVDAFALDVVQGPDTYHAEFAAVGDAEQFVLTHEVLDAAGIDTGLGATFCLTHRTGGVDEVVDVAQDVAWLPQPSPAAAASERPIGETPQLPALPIDAAGELPTDSSGDLVDAIDHDDFDTGGRCAVLQEGLPVLESPIDYSGFYHRGSGWQFHGYV